MGRPGDSRVSCSLEEMGGRRAGKGSRFVESEALVREWGGLGWVWGLGRKIGCRVMGLEARS